MDDEFKKLERLYHRFYDENGKLRKITSTTNEKGVVTYVMERPRVKTPLVPECKLHEYEDVASFAHDYEQCKHCKHKKYR
jgi:hypothetical protein